MQGAEKGIEQELDGLGLHIGIVQARFNEGITNALAVACIHQLEELGVHDIDHVLVPGALEIPIALQAMAERGEYDALESHFARLQRAHCQCHLDHRKFGTGHCATDRKGPRCSACRS